MAKYILTNKAVEDLGNIWNYTDNGWSEKQADSYYQMLIDSCQEIADNPRTGRSYPGIRADLSGLRVGRHIIFFRSMDKAEVEITRILHGRMDLKKRILE